MLREENAREKRYTGMSDACTEFQAKVQWVSHFLSRRGDADTMSLCMLIVTSHFPRAVNLLTVFGSMTGKTLHVAALEIREKAPTPPADTWQMSNGKWSGAHAYKVGGGNGAWSTGNEQQLPDEGQKAARCDARNWSLPSVLFVTGTVHVVWRRAAA
jgi:hypothetical protein